MRRSGTQHELAVAPEVIIERKRLGNAELLHDDEAERVAERVSLVGVALEQLDGASLIKRAHSLDVAKSILDIVEKPYGKLPAVARTDARQGVGLPDHGIGGDQGPGFAGSPLEERSRLEVVGVFRNQMREKRAGVDEDPLHGFVAEASARYLFLRLEMSAASA